MTSTGRNQPNRRVQRPGSFEAFTGSALVHSRLSDRVYAFVLSEVFDGVLKPGQRITEGRLAEELDVSMVSVREAMAKLAQDGWVERYPNRGSYVTNFAGRDTYHGLCRVRATIEIGAFHHLAEHAETAQLARLGEIVESMQEACCPGGAVHYQQCDIEFHQSAVHFTGGERLANLFRPVLLQCLAFSSAQPDAADFLDNTVDVRYPQFSHTALMQALADHQAAQAAQLIEQHVMLVSDAYMPEPG